MAWPERIQQGSFRGAVFDVLDHDAAFGRRVEVHEYPLRDLPWTEDLGRAARHWTVQCVVIGPDYDLARDRLIAACEAAGPGTLVHPYLGTHRAVCVGGRIVESTAEGGWARFTLDMVEAGSPIAPAAAVDTQGEALASAASMDAAAAAGVEDRFSVEGAPDYVGASAIAGVQGALDAMEGAASRLTGSGSGLYQFARRAGAIRDRVLTLARTPGQLAREVLDTVAQLSSLARTPAAALAALEPLLWFGSSLALSAGLATSARRERANGLALMLLVRQAAAIEAVRAVSQIEFSSYDDAVLVRARLADAIDALETDTADAGDETGWRALGALRLAMIRDVTARGGSMARLFVYQPRAVEPALVLAYRIYGDAGRDGEIVARNRVTRPGFVPAGAPLELLSPIDREVGRV